MTNIEKLKLCNLSEYIDSITGMPANSASNSDTWIVHFGTPMYRKTTEGEQLPVETAFLKISLTYKDMRALDKCAMDEKYDEEDDDLAYNVKGLEYEAKVYEKFIKPLIDQKICPHFVRSYGRVKSCSYNDLVKMVKKVGIPEANLKRNMALLWEAHRHRPAIDGDYNQEQKEFIIASKYLVAEYFVHEFHFRYLMTETVNALSFYKWLREAFWKEESLLADKYKPIIEKYGKIKGMRKIADLLFENISDHNKKLLYDALFQILYTLKCMRLNGMTHSDLHLGNIFMYDNVPSTDIRYIVKGEKYDLPNVTCFVKVYDFDRSSVESVGRNKLAWPDAVAWKDVAKIACIFQAAFFFNTKHLFGIKQKKFYKKLQNNMECFFYDWKADQDPGLKLDRMLKHVYDLCKKVRGGNMELKKDHQRFKCKKLDLGG